MRSSRLLVLGTLALVLVSGAVLAQDIPLNNWTVPPYTQSSRGGIHTMTDATPPRVFIGIQPCRVADTRGNGAPIQGGIFTDGQVRTWDLTGICGIPAGADAISANFTVTGAPAAPPGAFILAWPTGGPVPPVSILNFQAGQTIANAAIVPLGAGEQINVNASHSTHILMDVNGYFSDVWTNAANYLFLTNNSTAQTVWADNNSTTCAGACGVYVTTSSGNAVWGSALETTGDVNYGVYGSASCTGTNCAGVYGTSNGATGQTFGVRGFSSSTSNGSAGVYGIGDTVAAGSTAIGSRAGVRGTSGPGGFGVIAFSESAAIGGFLMDTAGTIIAAGRVANTGFVDPPGLAPWALFGQIGDTGGVGTKSFVEPHPTDPSKEIVYISLEGPEAGTYFRGRGKFDRGMARIPVPEDFRLVTDPENLTVQVTPIGAMATVGVMKMGLDEIVVQSSRNVEFSYLVQGVRATYKDRRPIRSNSDFVPESANQKIPGYVEAQKRLLIQNGTYNADGTVNMDTARRLGWDHAWERHRPQPQPQPPNP